MKEVYRSFEGKLNVDQREGYVVYDCGDVYEIHHLSVYSDVRDSRMRVFKEDLPDLTDTAKIAEIELEICDGVRRGAIFYRCRWYNQDLINKIQRMNDDMNWRRYAGR